MSRSPQKLCLVFPDPQKLCPVFPNPQKLCPVFPDLQKLCLMPSDLRIALPCHCPVEQVQPLEHCIGTVPPADLEHGSLDPALSLQRVIVREKIHLECSCILLHLNGADTQSSVQQPVVSPAVKLVQQSLADRGDGVGRNGQTQGSSRMPGMQPPVEVD